MKTALGILITLGVFFSTGAVADQVTDPELLRRLQVLFEDGESKALHATAQEYSGVYLCNETDDKLVWFSGKTIEHEELPSLTKMPALLVTVDDKTQTIDLEGNHFDGIALKINGLSVAGLEAVGQDNRGQIYAMIFAGQKLRLTRTSMGEVRVLSAKCNPTSSND